MSNILNLVLSLQSTNSTNEKEVILRNIESGSIEDLVLRFLFDNNITSGIKRTKLNKYTHLEFDNDQPYSGGFEELFEYLSNNKTGKEDDIKYVVNSAKLARNTFGEEFEQLIYSVVCKDLKLGCGASTYNKAHPTNPVFDYNIMGGKAYEEERARKLIRNGEQLFFTAKIDGNRGTRDMYTCSKMVSRNGKEWKGTESILKELNKLVGFDRVPEGEFVFNDLTGKMTSQELRAKTTSIMGTDSIEDKAEAGIVFKIFDVPLKADFNEFNEGEPYYHRRLVMSNMSKEIRKLGLKYVQIIPIEFSIATEDRLEEVIPRTKDFIEKGNEGYMCISSNQPYKTGKGYGLMKLKNIISADLRISGWNYGKEKTKWEGKFASFTVDFPYVDKDGVKGIYQVDVGMGYSDEFRNKVNENPDSYIGRLIEILVTEVSKNKQGGYSLSYARFVELRDDKDAIDLEEHSLVEIDGEFYFKEDKEK